MPTPTDHPTTDRAGEQVAHEVRVKFTSAGTCPQFLELYPRLLEALSPEQWGLVSRAIVLAQQAESDKENDELWALVDGVARHFPGFGPAIRATARHIFEAGAPEDCGVLGDALSPDGRPGGAWVECLGPTPAA
jgi:hypothetical protein